MDRKRKVSMPFTTALGEELRVLGDLIESPYNSYFEFQEAYLIDDPTEFFEEDDLLEEDLERLPQEAEDFLDEGTLFRS